VIWNFVCNPLPWMWTIANVKRRPGLRPGWPTMYSAEDEPVIQPPTAKCGSGVRDEDLPFVEKAA
jgi:hypothetical protein